MKKVSRIIISVLLIILMLVPSSVFVRAEDVTSTTPTKQTYGPYEYYNLKDGLYTKKTVEGPNADGTYDVTIDSYTSDVKYVSAEKTGAIDIMALVDNSNSMTGKKASAAQSALKKVLADLLNNYGAGTKYTANISIWTFSNVCTDAFSKVLDYTELTQKKLPSINTAINLMKFDENVIAGGTNTGAGLAKMNDLIGKRQLDNPSNTQVLLLLTDGVPSLGTAGFDGSSGEKYANEAIKQANALKASGVSIYCLGIDSAFRNYEQNKNTLSKIVTDGYYYTYKDGLLTKTAKAGQNKDIRRATLFLNIISSGWTTNSTKSFDWQTDDNSESSTYYSYSDKGDLDTKYYQKWAKNLDKSWEAIPSYYTQYISESYPDAQYFFGEIDENSIAENLSKAVIYSISSHHISQGSLLGDYTIKDTVNSYFEVVPDSTAIYQVPYAASKDSSGNWTNAYAGPDANGSNTTQYGESSRKWGTPIDITDKIEYTEATDSINVTAFKDSSAVFDTCVTDDIVDKNNESHSGNKLRVTYKIRPKDSFMGAYSVATHDYNNSGIFKETVDSSNNTVYQAVQKFASLDNLKRVQNITPEVAVSLVSSRLNVSDDNVKIGMLYDINALGQNYSIEYDGRYSGNTYSLKYNNGTLSAYDSSNSLITYKSSTDGSETYPTDYVTLKTGSNVLGTGCENVVTDGTYIQFNSSGIKLTDGTYSKTTPVIGKKMYIAWKTIDGASTLDDIINRFNAYNAAGQTDENATASQGIVNNVYYGRGFARVQQLLGADNVNVYVPMLTVSDSVINSISGATWNVSSNSLESTLSNFDSQSYNSDADSYNNALNAITDVNINYSVDIYKNNNTGKSENRFVLLEPLSEDNSKVAVVKDNADTTFINDFYGNNGQFVKMSAYMLKFADKDGNVRNSGDSIKEGDKFKIILTYDSMYTDILSKQSAPFKATVDEHYTTAGECSMCKTTPFTPSFLGYDAQIHLVSNAITVTKQGCDENHLNESFVFSLVGIKENSEGTDKDLSTKKVLSNFTIQGNGTKIIPVDVSEYQYFYVVEDTNAKETNGWTWDYRGVKLDGSDTNGWTGIASEAFRLEPGENQSLIFTNEYNTANEGLHYSSAYCSNILSKGNNTTVTGSHSISTNTEG